MLQIYQQKLAGTRVKSHACSTNRGTIMITPKAITVYFVFVITD